MSIERFLAMTCGELLLIEDGYLRNLWWAPHYSRVTIILPVGHA